MKDRYLPSSDYTRYVIRDATANYRHKHLVPPEWLVEALPGAAALRNAWEQKNGEGRELAASLPLPALARPASTAEEEEHARLNRERQQKLARQGDAARRALGAFDDFVYATGGAPGARATAAAREASSAHEAAVEAWAVLSESLERREQAYHLAGAPGLPWEAQVTGGAAHTRRAAKTAVDAQIKGFPLAAVEEVAAGNEDPMDIGTKHEVMSVLAGRRFAE